MLDTLWKSAEEFGRPALEKERGALYNASINFNTEKGSSIWARGRGETACAALEGAIKEARALSAGVIMANQE